MKVGDIVSSKNYSNPAIVIKINQDSMLVRFLEYNDKSFEVIETPYDDWVLNNYLRPVIALINDIENDWFNKIKEALSLIFDVKLFSPPLSINDTWEQYISGFVINFDTGYNFYTGAELAKQIKIANPFKPVMMIDNNYDSRNYEGYYRFIDRIFFMGNSKLMFAAMLDKFNMNISPELLLLFAALEFNDVSEDDYYSLEKLSLIGSNNEETKQILASYIVFHVWRKKAWWLR